MDGGVQPPRIEPATRSLLLSECDGQTQRYEGGKRADDDTDRSFTVGDSDWVERHVLNGAELRLIGTNPDEWLHGVDAFTLFRQEAAAATGALTADVSDVEAYLEGDVGWAPGVFASRPRTD